MKLISTKILSCAAVLCLASTSANALQYTATASGNFSSTSVWLGGVVPPNPLLGANDIIINSGVTITLDRDLTLSNTNSLLQMKGTAKIISTSKNYLSVKNGFFLGDLGCSIDVDSVFVDSNPQIQFYGSITANTLALSGAPFSLNVTLNVNKTLRLTGTMASQLTLGTMTLSTGTPRPVIVFDGGELTVGSSATFNLTNPYNVRYENTGKQIGTGWELLGAGCTDLDVAVGSSNSTSLYADLNVKGALKLTSGTLTMNSFNINLGANGTIDAAGGSGTISSNGGSDIKISSTAGTIGSIRFDALNNIIDNFTMNTGAGGGIIELLTDMSVATKLDLQDGKINVKGNNLIISPTATISGGSSNSYIITEQGGALRQDIAGNAIANYPVGHMNAYTPISIESKNGTQYTEMGVNVSQGVKAHATMGADLAASQPVVDATWIITQQSTTNLDYAIELKWQAGSEVNSFDRGNSFVTMYNTDDWEKTTPTAASTTGSMYSQKKDGITSLGSFAVFDQNTVNVKDFISGNIVNLYPNPAKNSLRLDLQTETTATIYNLSGQAVNTSLLNNASNIIDITDLPSGMYIIHLASENVNGTGRFVKQ
ncbi:MAG: T9SS type A sorting domain-containing protein [Chitinophagales bacterium]|nr:T9SS type A sorting domain-containing protein [Chitinophagales bacterium]